MLSHRMNVIACSQAKKRLLTVLSAKFEYFQEWVAFAETEFSRNWVGGVCIIRVVVIQSNTTSYNAYHNTHRFSWCSWAVTCNLGCEPETVQTMIHAWRLQRFVLTLQNFKYCKDKPQSI